MGIVSRHRGGAGVDTVKIIFYVQVRALRESYYHLLILESMAGCVSGWVLSRAFVDFSFWLFGFAME